ncbi:hypothetical protein PanWU01x14_118290 [Parasponia andersonii]|uniref:Uncharacterized protein n=1 Tax=Parasponia andersonii TaxID=3476 RepID=A0A2P5CW79_PARAD|nr:hypothetical protein PanWU01x14_118290 [Parasponia andersonii]
MCILVIVHPHLQNVSLHPNLGAELVDRRLVLPLNPPPNPLREFQHPILLLRREFCPESLPSSAPAAATRGGPGGHGRDPILPLRRLRRPAIVLPPAAILVTIPPTVTMRRVVAARRPDHHLRFPPRRGGGGIVEERHGRRRRRVLDAAEEDNFAAVEVAVAAAGGAGERVAGGGVFEGGTAAHELAAAVVCVAADGGRVVPHALSVLDIGVGIGGLETVLVGGGLGLHHVAILALVLDLG